jgi:hypothetical protein
MLELFEVISSRILHVDERPGIERWPLHEAEYIQNKGKFGGVCVASPILPHPITRPQPVLPVLGVALKQRDGLPYYALLQPLSLLPSPIQ